MNYKFPRIQRIEDVLPAIEGRDEFIVAERDDFDVINYMVGMPDSFTIDENDLMDNYGEMIPKGVMRRECRGLIFNKEGFIISRPFHKFFNVGERDETQINMLDLSTEHVIMEKMDGSMIRPLFLGGKLRLGTKMGITDVGNQAEQCLQVMSGVSPAEWDMAQLGHVENAYRQWFIVIMQQHITPLFEFVSPQNRIVLKYDKSELVLLALRNNVTGEYYDIEEMRGMDFFNVVPTYGSVVGNFGEYIERQRKAEGREGDIIMWPNGHMVKIKNEWYVKIHKVKDMIRTDRHILALVLDNNIDDVLPHLDAEDLEYIRDFEASFWNARHKKFSTLTKSISALLDKADGNKKEMAVNILPNSGLPKSDWPFVFSVMDGKVFSRLFNAHIRKSLGNGPKYEAMMKWLEN